MTNMAVYEAKAKILKALAHPTRLLFVECLQDGERCVCELNELVDADVSTVSKHLTVLKNAGLVEDDKRGLQVYYRLTVPCVLSFMGCIERVIEDRARKQSELLR